MTEPCEHTGLANIITQVGLLVFTGTALLLVGRRETWYRWAYPLALLGEVFWFSMAYIDLQHQWGVFLLNVVATVGWAQGFWFHWIKRKDLTSASAQGTVHRKLEAVDP